MKKTLQARLPLAIAALVAAIFAANGCKKDDSTSNPQAVAAPQASAEKNSFKEVTSHLDAGGNFYLYLSTESWLDGLSAKISGWRGLADSVPNMKEDDRKNVGRAFDLVTGLVKDSGIEDISGVGISSIAREKGFYHSKFILHHYKGKGDGFLWNMMGKAPHALTGLDLLPVTTAMATFSDGDLPLVWSAIEKEVDKSGIPEAKAALKQLPDLFEKGTGLKLDQVLDSLGGECGLAITLDESKMISIPTPQGQGFQVPEPGILLVIKVKNDLIYDRVDKLVAQLPGLIRTDKDGKMLTMPVPVPLPITLRPSLARSGDYLLLATTDGLIEEALAVKAGKKPGLKSLDEFKKLSQGMPVQGNEFSFVSEKLGRVILAVQNQSLENMPESQSDFMKKLIAMNQTGHGYSVSVNSDEGWITESNGSQDPSKMVLVMPAALAVGMAAGLTLPAVAKAKEKSQRMACISHLQQINNAKQQWALENKKKPEDTPTWDDIKPLLGSSGSVPVCPRGGSYELNRMDQQPTCSIPGHEME